MKRISLGALLLGVMGCPLTGATFTVTNTADSGAGSLRQAILDSNASVGVLDTIAFNITGTGCSGAPAVCAIQPASGLPNVQDPVIIDGYTQPGSSPNTFAVGNNAVLLVEIDGSLTGGAYGLFVLTNATVIKGLVINRFLNQALGYDSTGGQGTLGGHVIQGNFIGTDATGMLAAGNLGFGVFLRSPDNLVGGPNPADRNVIAANNSANVRVDQSFGASVAGTVIQGNYIGTNAAGTASLGGTAGVEMVQSTSVTVGGDAPGEGNLISGTTGYGISMGLISCGNPSSSNVIQGNLIGTDATGTLPVPNTSAGIYLGCLAADNLVGGTAPGAGNVVAYNGGSSLIGGGIRVVSSAGTGNRVRGNSIFENTSTGALAGRGLGIDLDPDGVTANDPGDPDSGPNNRQNFPIVSAVTILAPQGAGTRIQGVLHSAASTTYDLDFYANAACSNFPREFLEGQTYLGSGQVTTDGAGTGNFDITLPATIQSGQPVSATATDPSGNTSELSQRIVLSMTPTSGPASGGTDFNLSGTDFAAGAIVTVGGLPAANVNVGSSIFITGTTPALPAGTANDVTVVNTDGSAGTLVKGFIADFLDVPNFHQFYSFVSTLVSNAITVGVGGGIYGVDQPTLRQQMAVFLLKAKFGLCYAPPPCTGVFGDVPCSLVFAPWIEALAAAGITGGCGPGIYCPQNPVRRDQMAVFLLKTKYGSAYVPPACAGVFDDVACPAGFAVGFIEQLAAEQITGGCSVVPPLYCPLNNNTRGQMAVFITKTFNLQ